MTKLKNDRLLRALLREPVDMTPVWIMRQAGRYLPEYRATREKAGDFITLCTTPELACEVALQPLARFALDAAILFSDILTIPQAMGLGLHFAEGEGPCFERPLRSERDIAALAVPDPESELRYVLDTVRLLRRELAGRIPLIGFAGSPWTLAAYMVEGGSSRDFARVKTLLYEQPTLMHRLLQTLADAVTCYLNAQVDAGAQALMIFDTWGGVLTPRDYGLYSIDYMAHICAHLRRESEGRRVPVILFSRNATASLEVLAAAGADAVGVDWTIDLGEARRRVGAQVGLQGNMDPAVLYASPERIREEAAAVLASFGHGSGHVFNLGHGITPDIDPDHVAVLVDVVHELSPAYHQQ